jgi:beta-galactosidase
VQDLLTRTGQLATLGHPTWPVVRKTGVNSLGRRLAYYLNYSDSASKVPYRGLRGKELLTDRGVNTGETLTLERWGVAIVEEDRLGL